MSRKDWTRREEAQLASWRRARVKLAVIAARLGRSVDSVKHKLCRLRVVVAPRYAMRRKPRSLFRAVAARLRAGESVTDAAEATGSHYSYVSRVRKRIGLPPASASERAQRAWQLRRA